MRNRSHSGYLALAIVVGIVQANQTFGITSYELAKKCQSIESAIKDVSLDYEWYNIPSLTRDEEQEEPFKSIGMLYVKDGVAGHNLSAARFTDANGQRQWRYVIEESSTLVGAEGETWKNVVKYSYDGDVRKRLTIGGWPQPTVEGYISANENAAFHELLTPLGFSIFRFGMDEVTKKRPLSTCLGYKEIVRGGDSVIKVNDFNTVCFEFLQEYSKLPCIRVYFSVDHNYTPVKYEYLASGTAGTRVNFAVEVASLARVGEGLWFPSSGLIRVADNPGVDAFQATGTIRINAGLSKADFDVNFPPGTKVWDAVNQREFVVTPLRN
jgi:hypothetical protein